MFIKVGSIWMLQLGDVNRFIQNHRKANEHRRSKICSCIPDQTQLGHPQGEIQITTLANISDGQPWLMALDEQPLMCSK